MTRKAKTPLRQRPVVKSRSRTDPRSTASLPKLKKAAPKHLKSENKPLKKDAIDYKGLVRIQKYLSDQGILSRRKTEAYLQAGWIKVNGKVVTTPGLKIDPEIDKIELDDAIIWRKQRYQYIAFYKPKGIVTNCPLKDETQIIDILPPKMRKLHSVGRLDKDSEGLILLTDDGIFAKNLLQQNDPHIREYLVWTNDPITPALAKSIEDGTLIGGEKTKPCTIKLLSDTYFKISLFEGKNRQIRRMIQQTGRFVVRLKRIRYGSITLGNLEKGEYRPLNEKEVQSLLQPK